MSTPKVVEVSQRKVSEELIPVIVSQWLEHSNSQSTRVTLERHLKEHLFPSEQVDVWEESARHWQQSQPLSQ